YVWNKMKVLQNSVKVIDWKKWQNKNREDEIVKEIDRIAPPWVEFTKFKCAEVEEGEMDRPFTMNELERALGMAREKSAPGLDHIEYRMIKGMSKKFKNELLAMFKYCFTESKMFSDWKENQVIFIDKSNKEKVRPITLSSCMGKVLERLVNERLMWWAENNVLDKNQNGFRKGWSCLNNITKLAADIEMGFLEEKCTIAAFLDVSAAYDNVNRDTNRTERRLVNKGLPQGGVLSSILYAIYTKNISRNLNYVVKILQYADDIVLYISGKYIAEMEVDLETGIKELNKRLIELGLDLLECCNLVTCVRKVLLRWQNEFMFRYKSCVNITCPTGYGPSGRIIERLRLTFNADTYKEKLKG
ncbi:hypothetical protein DMN91_000234, partial [Ooceraea biroi]